MNYTYSKIICIAFCLITSLGFSQEKAADTSTIPESIYTPTQMDYNLNSISFINDRLNLKNHKFVFIDTRNADECYVTLPVSSLGQAPTKYIYDTYAKIYETKNLTQAFFKVSDLYRVRAINPLQ